MGLAWGQNNCTADDGTEGIELWGICYFNGKYQDKFKNIKIIY